MTPIFRSSSQCWSPSTWPTYSSSSTAPRTYTSVRVRGRGQGAALRFPTQWHPVPRGASPFPMDTNLRFRWKERVRLKSPKSSFMEAHRCPLKGPYAPACVWCPGAEVPCASPHPCCHYGLWHRTIVYPDKVEMGEFWPGPPDYIMGAGFQLFSPFNFLLLFKKINK